MLETNFDNRYINICFGFAVKKSLDKYQRELLKAEISENKNDIDKLQAIITYLLEMRILHKYDLLNKKYMANCYALSDQI